MLLEIKPPLPSAAILLITPYLRKIFNIVKGHFSVPKVIFRQAAEFCGYSSNLATVNKNLIGLITLIKTPNFEFLWVLMLFLGMIDQ